MTPTPRTNFVITEKSGLQIGEPVADKPVVKQALLATLEVSYYKGQVTWQIPVKIPEGTPAGDKTIEGMIGYQACTDSSCHQPMALKFTTTIRVADASGDQAIPIELVSTKRADALDAAAMTKWVDPIKLGCQLRHCSRLTTTRPRPHRCWDRRAAMMAVAAAVVAAVAECLKHPNRPRRSQSFSAWRSSAD